MPKIQVSAMSPNTVSHVPGPYTPPEFTPYGVSSIFLIVGDNLHILVNKMF